MKKKHVNKPIVSESRKQIQQPEVEGIQKQYSDFLGLALIILLGIIIYSNSFNCSFHFDDSFNIVDNINIRNLFDVNAWWSSNRRVAFLTFALNYHFNQLDVWYWHLVNVAIHLSTSIVVWWLTLLIFSSPALKDHPIVKHKKTIALLCALLFVSHPLATQSVTYIVQRMALLAALFYLLSLSLYVKARLMNGPDRSKYLLFSASFISGLLALFSKENAFTLPFALLLYEICFLQEKKISINFKDYRVLMVLTAFVGFISYVLFVFSLNVLKPIPPDVYNDYRTITPINYLLTQFSVVVKYIGLLILPINQSLDHDVQLSNSFLETRTILSFLLLFLLFISGIFLFKKYRILSFGIFWFFLTISIESSIIPISDLIFEHRTYLPSFGFTLFLSSGIYLLFWDKYKHFAISIFLIIIGTNSFLTFQRNKVWKDDFTLWSDVIKKSPNKARSYNIRGYFFTKTGKNDEALKDFNKAIELQPKFDVAYYNRATIYIQMKNYEQALLDLDKAIEFNPTYAKAYNNRGNLFTLKEEYEIALKEYKMAIELDQNYSDAYNNRGMIYNLQKKYELALNDYNKALELNSSNAKSYYERGNVYKNLSQIDKAMADYSKAIGIDPKFSKAYYNRGITEFNLGEKAAACKDMNQAAALGYQPAKDALNKICN